MRCQALNKELAPASRKSKAEVRVAVLLLPTLSARTLTKIRRDQLLADNRTLTARLNSIQTQILPNLKFARSVSPEPMSAMEAARMLASPAPSLSSLTDMDMDVRTLDEPEPEMEGEEGECGRCPVGAGRETPCTPYVLHLVSTAIGRVSSVLILDGTDPPRAHRACHTRLQSPSPDGPFRARIRARRHRV